MPKELLGGVVIIGVEERSGGEDFHGDEEFQPKWNSLSLPRITLSYMGCNR